MRALIFIIVSYTGILLFLFLGKHLLDVPKMSSRRFALPLACTFAGLHFFLALISGNLDMESITFASLQAFFSFGVGYLILHYLHKHLKSKHD